MVPDLLNLFNKFNKWKHSPIISLVVFILLINLIIWYLYAQYNKNITSSTSPATTTPLYWIDPMEPAVHYPGPGKSRMGMDLVAIYPNTTGADKSNTIVISPNVINNIGIKTEVARKEKIMHTVEAYGYITFDETKVSHIHTYANGWVRKLYVKATGDIIKKNQPLFGLYSPTLIQTKEEFALSLSKDNKELTELARNRLRALNISQEQIEEIEALKDINPLTLTLSPHDGILATLEIREGMYVTPENTIMSIVDPSVMWIILEVFPKDANYLAVDQDVTITIPGSPEVYLKKKIAFIYPQLDPQTKTIRVRIPIDNPENKLKAQQLVKGTIALTMPKEAITIDNQAIIYGQDTYRVIVMHKNGEFEPRIITIGLQNNNRVEVTSGVAENELVVTSGQFLLDSEASLQGLLNRMILNRQQFPPKVTMPAEPGSND